MDIDDAFGAFEEGKEEQQPSLGKRPTQIAQQDLEQLEKDARDLKRSKQEEDVEMQSNSSESDSDDQDQNIEVKAVSGFDPDNFDVTKKIEANCLHEHICPKGHKRQPVSGKPPAREYKFQLDTFQAKAVDCMERQESVLVAAHTSAGKTAVAEYAIALALRDNQRVIYTSPIKALSNQKFRQLQEEFGEENVGLMTGDVTQNESASCIVMTTEILRSMLYKGSEITKEMAWVIFDEVHYMRDKERGVVWEETIILLPSIVKYVFLSATIPNAHQFGQWIATIKKQPCNIVYTDYRPVPLEHYMHASGTDQIYLVVDKQSKFREDNFNQAVAKMDTGNDLAEKMETKGKKKAKKNTEQTELRGVINFVISRDYGPCICFAFSKSECENFARILSKCEYTTQEERELINQIYENAVQSLSDEDKDLPMIKGLLPLLQKGIGVHHGGLLPIAKEIVEIMFQEGLLKVLFTTETFSMGINMPARTVIFTALEKFDGDEFRFITGGEYIQMSGRAGRRGLDDKGVCILMANKSMEHDQAISLLQGSSDPLNSSFHLSYNMLLLSLLSYQDYKPDYLIGKSFKQFQTDSSLPELKREYQSLQEQLKGYQFSNHKQLKRHFEITNEMEEL